MQLGLANNLDLVVSRAARAAADADVQFAAGAFDPLPQLSYTTDRLKAEQMLPAGDVRGSSTTGALNGGVTGLLSSGASYQLSMQTLSRRQSPLLNQTYPTERDNTVGFLLSQPLLKGFGRNVTRSSLLRAQFRADAAAAQLARTKETLVATIEILFHDLVQKDAQTAVADRSLGRARNLLARNKALLALRKISEIDLTTSELGVLSRESLLLDAQQSRGDALERLLATIHGRNAGVELGRDVVYRVIAPEIGVPALPAPEAAESAAIAQRNDVTAAVLSTDDSEQGIRLARNGMLPVVDLTLGYSASLTNADAFRLSAGRLQEFQNRGWTTGFVIGLPALNRSARASRTQADVLLQQDLTRLESVKNSVRTEVRSAIRAMELGNARLQRAEGAVKLAYRQYEGEEQRLRLGLSDPFRLLQTEEQAAQADLNVTIARALLARALTQFDLAMGTIMTKYPAVRAN